MNIFGSIVGILWITAFVLYIAKKIRKVRGKQTIFEYREEMFKHNFSKIYDFHANARK